MVYFDTLLHMSYALNVHRHALNVHRHAKKHDFPIDFAIFTKALRTDRRTDGPTDGRTYPLIEMR